MNRIPVNRPLLDGNEKKYINDCIDTGWISSSGSYIDQFEKGMAKYVGKKYGVAVSNGTTALEAAVLALNLEPGSEVIMPDFTIISCVQAIVKAGLIPVPVDCSLETWNMNTDLIESAITSKTKAIMVVHIYGLPTDMTKVFELAKKHHLKIIEDAAEAHGLTWNNKMCGGMGDVSIFSFFPNKHITSGEGGMIMTDDEAIYNRAKQVRNLFFDPERRYIHEEFGSNFRMTNMQAAIGLAQLEKIDRTLIKKREIGNKYYNAFKEFKNIILQTNKTAYADNIYWVFGIVMNDGKHDADYMMKVLGEHGIETRHFFYPMHKQPALIKNGCCKKEIIDDKKFPNANFICKNGFYIPSGVGITDEEQDYVIETVRKILKEL